MSSHVKIAILDDYQNCALSMADWSVLPPDAEITVFTDNIADPDALAERLLPFQVICAMRERTRFDRAAIDMATCEELGITVSGTGAAPNSTPELTWGVILALLRNIPAEVNSVRSGGWMVGVGGDLRGRTLALMGLGIIGSEMAKIGIAFGMKIIAWSENLTAEKAEAAGARLVDKETLFRDGDVVCIHTVLSTRTRGIVGAHELGLMKPTAYLINTSRGPIIDEPALIDVLTRGAIAGAALDAYVPEPMAADHPFRTLPNVLATPHIGYVTEDTYRIFYGETVENIAGFLAGKPERVIGQVFKQYAYTGVR